ncbi:MAG: lysylphosphatidylglycerol synthase transmembrane domain-containing protein [Candidatus Micrarchaeota archaeon]
MDKKTYIINIAITLAIIIAIFYFVDIGKVIEELTKVDMKFIVLAILVYIVLNVLMAKRIQKLLSAMGHKTSLSECVQANFGGMLLSDFTPVRSGYFFTAFSLSSKKGIPIEKTMLSIFGPQIFEFLLKVVCSGVLIFVVISNLIPKENQNITLLLLVVMGLGMLFLIALLFSKRLLQKFEFMKKLPGGKKLFYLMKLMQDNSNVLLKEWPVVFGVLFGAWVLKGIEWLLIAQSLGIEITAMNEFVFFLLFHSSITFLHFMPFPTIAGAGASEAISAGILSLLGVPLEKGLTFAILTRALMIFVDLIGLISIGEFIKKGKFFELLNTLDKTEEKGEEKVEGK